MLVKVTGRRDGAGTLCDLGPPLPCRRVDWLPIVDMEGREIGLRVELVYFDGQRAQFELPRDGNRVWVMNTRGDTVDSIPWPPRDHSNNKDGQTGKE